MTASQGSPERPQVGLSTLLARPAALTIGAAVCMLLAMVLPLVSVSVNMGGLPLGAVSLAGSALLGMLGWLGVVAFGAAVATRILPSAMPYRSIMDLIAMAMWAVLVVLLAYHAMNPIPADASAAVSGMGNLMGGSSGRPGANNFANEMRRAAQQAISVTPSFGLVPFLAAGPLAWLGARRARRALQA